MGSGTTPYSHTGSNTRFVKVILERLLSPGADVRLIFYSCASDYDVSPFVMGRKSPRSDKHSATLNRSFPLIT
jgi:hypothetical protein